MTDDSIQNVSFLVCTSLEQLAHCLVCVCCRIWENLLIHWWVMVWIDYIKSPENKDFLVFVILIEAINCPPLRLSSSSTTFLTDQYLIWAHGLKLGWNSKNWLAHGRRSTSQMDSYHKALSACVPSNNLESRAALAEEDPMREIIIDHTSIAECLNAVEHDVLYGNSLSKGIFSPEMVQCSLLCQLLQSWRHLCAGNLM